MIPIFLIDQTLQEINQRWKLGTCKRMRPDERKRIFEAEKEINRLALNGYIEALREALKGYKRSILNEIDNEF